MTAGSCVLVTERERCITVDRRVRETDSVAAKMNKAKEIDTKCGIIQHKITFGLRRKLTVTFAVGVL